MGNYTIISKDDVLKLKYFPYFVLSSDLSSFLGYAIRSHTKHGYSHSMSMIVANQLASQEWKMKSVPLENYLTESTRLKFWYNPDWTEHEKFSIINAVKTDLEEGGRYDWLGVALGQLTGLKWLNFSGRNYCSEQVGAVIKKVDSEFNIYKPSPADIDVYFTNNEKYRAFVYDPTL